MKTSDFEYHLPSELIAQQPLPDRAASRMLVVDRATGEIRHDSFRNIGRYLRAGDLLVLNDTKVIPARIWAKAPVVELLLIENLGGHRWSALVKPAKKAKRGTLLTFVGANLLRGRSGLQIPPTELLLTATVEDETNFGGRVLQFTGDVDAYIATHGSAPLPPYIKRAVDAGDLQRYQTVFAQRPGAVAAPTAGLHFTPELLEELQAAGIERAFLTLHVGIGTFRPVKAENVEEHKMHAERFSIPAETAAAVRAARGSDIPVATPNVSGQAGRGKDAPPTGKTGRVVAVGTTVVRTLESLEQLRAHEGTTDIFIHPPFEFRYVDVMLTNFHLPRSTLLMLVSAFASRELILRAYAEAVRERYRFFSYGDCMLIV